MKLDDHSIPTVAAGPAMAPVIRRGTPARTRCRRGRGAGQGRGADPGGAPLPPRTRRSSRWRRSRRWWPRSRSIPIRSWPRPSSRPPIRSRSSSSQQWMAKHPGLKDKALADSVAKQPWDPSIQSMAVVPEVVKRLADDIQWTTELGNAFLAQQADVMDAVQALRKKADGQGRPRIERAAEGRHPGRREADGDRRAARQPRGRLRPGVQPDGRVRSAGLLSLSPHLLPAAAAPGRVLRRVHRRRRVAIGGLGWLVLLRRVGTRRRQHRHHQQQQQLQPDQPPRWRRQQQLAAQPGASRWGALPEPERSPTSTAAGRASVAGGASASTRPAAVARAVRRVGARAPVPSRPVARGGRAPSAGEQPGRRGRARSQPVAQGAGPERQHPASHVALPSDQVGSRTCRARAVARAASAAARAGTAARVPGRAVPVARRAWARAVMAAHGVVAAARGRWRRAPMMSTMTMRIPYRLGVAAALCGLLAGCGDRKVRPRRCRSGRSPPRRRR